MIYAETAQNLRYLLQIVGAATIHQLIVFFRDEAPPHEIKYHAKNLVRRGDADYNDRTGVLTWHRHEQFSPHAIKQRIEAFWVVAYYGSRAVKDIDSLKFPLQIEMILYAEDDEDADEPGLEVYDIAVCKTTSDGTIAARALQRYQIEGVPDEVVHLVIVPDAETGKKMIEHYGFDSWISLQKSHDPVNNIDLFIPEFHE